MSFFWLIMMGGFATSLTLGIIYCLKAMRANGPAIQSLAAGQSESSETKMVF